MRSGRCWGLVRAARVHEWVVVADAWARTLIGEAPAAGGRKDFESGDTILEKNFDEMHEDKASTLSGRTLADGHLD